MWGCEGVGHPLLLTQLLPPMPGATRGQDIVYAVVIGLNGLEIDCVDV